VPPPVTTAILPAKSFMPLSLRSASVLERELEPEAGGRPP
jgi:hypothetical protein